MSKRNKLEGLVFGKLTVIKLDYKDNYGHLIWLCKCSCGNITKLKSTALLNRGTKSCGCYRIDRIKETRTTHGLSKHFLYPTYISMLNRCYNPKTKCYFNYGERGIKVCDRWLESFENFLEDIGEKPEGLTLDRINNDGDYEKDNCRWVTYKEQNNNRRKRSCYRLKK